MSSYESMRLLPPNHGNRQISHMSSGSVIEDGDAQYEIATTKIEDGSGYTKSIILGGLDGLIASFVIISGTAGAKLSWKITLILGLSTLLANGVSIGISEFLSSKAHREFIQAEKRRATWQYKNFKSDEITRMISRLEKHGMSKSDAQVVTDKMAGYESLFVDRVLVEELGVQLPDDDDAALLADSFVMLTSYAGIGCIPLLSYFLCFVATLPEENVYGGAVAVTFVTLAALGIAKSSCSSTFWVYCVAETFLLAAVCGGLAYSLGTFLEGLFL